MKTCCPFLSTLTQVYISLLSFRESIRLKPLVDLHTRVSRDVNHICSTNHNLASAASPLALRSRHRRGDESEIDDTLGIGARISIQHLITRSNLSQAVLPSQPWNVPPSGKSSRGPEVALMPGAARTALMGGGSTRTGIMPSSKWMMEEGGGEGAGIMPSSMWMFEAGLGDSGCDGDGDAIMGDVSSCSCAVATPLGSAICDSGLDSGLDAG